MCIQICTEVLTSCNKARKSYKRYPYCKDANVLLFMDHMLMYIENLMELKKKQHTRTSEFIKATEYTNDKRKKIVFLYADNEQSEIKFTKAIPCTNNK